MEAIALRQQANRFNELQTGEVYYFRCVGFELADGRPPTALKIPREYYLVLHHRTQFMLVRANVSIPRLPSRFMDFIDVATLPNKMLTGLYTAVFAGSTFLHSQYISTRLLMCNISIAALLDIIGMVVHVGPIRFKTFHHSRPCREIMLMNIK